MKVLASYSIKGGVGRTTVERGVQRAPLAVFAPSAPGTLAYRQLWPEIAGLLRGRRAAAS